MIDENNKPERFPCVTQEDWDLLSKEMGEMAAAQIAKWPKWKRDLGSRVLKPTPREPPT